MKHRIKRGKANNLLQIWKENSNKDFRWHKTQIFTFLVVFQITRVKVLVNQNPSLYQHVYDRHDSTGTCDQDYKKYYFIFTSNYELNWIIAKVSGFALEFQNNFRTVAAKQKTTHFEPPIIWLSTRVIAVFVINPAAGSTCQNVRRYTKENL